MMGIDTVIVLYLISRRSVQNTTCELSSIPFHGHFPNLVSARRQWFPTILAIRYTSAEHVAAGRPSVGGHTESGQICDLPIEDQAILRASRTWLQCIKRIFCHRFRDALVLFHFPSRFLLIVQFLAIYLYLVQQRQSEVRRSAANPSG